MSVSVESIPVTQEPHAALCPAGAGDVQRDATASAREGVLEIPGVMRLHHGGRLPDVRIAWRLAGPGRAPVVCALGGISANRYVIERSPGEKGWWSGVVGPARALDTREYRVLSFDYLGSGESTGPQEGGAFPSISSYDQAEVLAHLIEHLGLPGLRAIAGGSYGGMVALAFGECYPGRVARLIVIGAADATHPLATAWRSIQRRIVRFAAECGAAQEGVKLARALAIATYRSPEEFAARFGGNAIRDGEHFVFPVEEYLLARGSDYAARHRAQTFLCLSESIDLHRIDPSRVFVPTTVIAIREDQLVPLADLRALAARLPFGQLHEISSRYGHDAFLKEAEQLRAIFAQALGNAA